MRPLHAEVGDVVCRREDCPIEELHAPHQEKIDLRSRSRKRRTIGETLRAARRGSP